MAEQHDVKATLNLARNIVAKLQDIINPQDNFESSEQIPNIESMEIEEWLWCLKWEEQVILEQNELLFILYVIASCTIENQYCSQYEVKKSIPVTGLLNKSDVRATESIFSITCATYVELQSRSVELAAEVYLVYIFA